MMHPAIDQLFEARFGTPPTTHHALAGDGSRRRMVRVGAEADTAVAVIGPDAKENRAFLAYTATFRELGLPVPEVYGVDEAAGVYLLEDLGDTTMFRALVQARGGLPGFPAAMLPIYRRVLEWLPRFQVEGGRAIDYSAAYPRAAFDRRAVLWDLNYFKYHFLKLAHIEFDEELLETDFQRLADRLLETDTSHFVYRDFQSRNVMLVDDAPRFIDYQGGRRGALQYDVASLLYDGKAAIPPETRAELLEHYLDVLGTYVAVDRARFTADLELYILVRIMQAMGAYGYRGFYERKPHFLASVPPAIDNIEHLLTQGAVPTDLPELRAVFERICAHDALRRRGAARLSQGLVVRVGSFSYRKGPPEDEGGHGGGYVFDCRGLPNPGREAAYKALTGRDAPVIAYLEALPETDAFYERAAALVLAHVDAFRARHFDSVTVHFGCTGGQHRSVYMAERLARTLCGRYPDATVPLTHHEQASWPARPDGAAGA